MDQSLKLGKSSYYKKPYLNKEVEMERLKKRFYFSYRHSFRSGKGVADFIRAWIFSKEVIFQ